jgi:hypothetical protein
MAWKEFMSMPDDIKVTYIKLLREKYNVPDKNLAEMFRVNKDYIYRTFKKLGLQRDVRISHPKWDKEGFYAWMNGVDKLPTPVPEEATEKPVIEEVPVITSEEPEVFVEDDLPVEDPEPFFEKFDALELENKILHAQLDELQKVHEMTEEKNEWLRNEWENNRMQIQILEAQMDVVRLIFGGKNNG